MQIVRLLLFVALAAGEATVSRAQKLDPFPADATRSYEPVSLHADAEYGNLRLSKTFASFSHLKGHMDLRFDGTMEYDGTAVYDGSMLQMYRVLNVEQFARQNPGQRACKPRWLGVKSAGPTSLWIWIFGIDDYRQYNPRKPGVCSGDVYVLSTRKK